MKKIKIITVSFLVTTVTFIAWLQHVQEDASSGTNGFDQAGRLVVVKKAKETGLDGMNVVRYHEINNLGKADLENETDITLFPNPSTGFFCINSGDSMIQRITVFDMRGLVVFSSDINVKAQKTINLHVELGIYLVCLESDHGRIVKHLRITK
jgi:Secretion system C-terminal sorting domain